MRTQPRPTLASIADYYPPSYVAFGAEPPPSGRLYDAARRVVRLPFHLRYGPPDSLPEAPTAEARALDIGCGTGLLLERLVERGWQPWGLEPDAQAADAAARRLHLDTSSILPVRAEEAVLPSGNFDLITMSHVLEHLHEPLRVLEKAWRWLGPEGSMRIWVPNIASFESRAFGRRWFSLDVPRHLQHFAPRTLSVAFAA